VSALATVGVAIGPARRHALTSRLAFDITPEYLS
jgi:hypothetical protein